LFIADTFNRKRIRKENFEYNKTQFYLWDSLRGFFDFKRDLILFYKREIKSILKIMSNINIHGSDLLIKDLAGF